jgi:hypothetical protein
MKHGFIGCLAIIATVAGSLLLLAGTASAQECASLTPLDCSRSTECTLEADQNSKTGFQCRPVANSCEQGFRQIIEDPDRPFAVTPQAQLAENCEAKEGCGYVESGSCYCPPIEGLQCYCSGGTPPSCQPTNQATNQIGNGLPMGRYTIISARNASDVAQTGIRQENIVDNWITFDRNGLQAEGLGCDSWEISSVDAVANLEDPILADVMVGPADSPLSSGDARELTSFEYACEGERFLSLTKIDDRVVVIPWDNYATYLIAEIPLNASEIRRFQRQLRSMKFYDGEMTGKMDEATQFAVSLWSGYRATADEDYRFLRPAITRNLLDTLKVLDPN